MQIRTSYVCRDALLYNSACKFWIESRGELTLDSLTLVPEELIIYIILYTDWLTLITHHHMDGSHTPQNLKTFRWERDRDIQGLALILIILLISLVKLLVRNDCGFIRIRSYAYEGWWRVACGAVKVTCSRRAVSKKLAS